MQKPLKPKIFKRHNIWHCQYRDKLTVGNTPKQAYVSMQWLRNKPIIMDDTLL